MHYCMKTSLISKIFPSVSPGVTKITLFKLLHQGHREVPLSPEQPEFPARARRVTTQFYRP